MLALAVSLLALAAALLGPSQTLAQARKLACPSTGAHASAKHSAHACVQPSHKSKSHHGKGHRGKHSLARVPREAATIAVPAACEDGSAPVQDGEGSFTCSDGSEPECEDGSTPTRSTSGKSLVCLISREAESEAETEAEAEAEASECEQSAAESCGLATLAGGSTEQTCATAAGAGPSFACEAES